MAVGVHYVNKKQRGLIVNIKLPRQELARLFGTSRETVSRKLSQLQNKGLIAFEGQKQIVILNIDKLRSPANGYRKL